MSFSDVFAEARERFSEAFQLINILDASEADRNTTSTAATVTDKALKGLTLVSIYAAVERSINYAVEQAIAEISNHGTPSATCCRSIIAIFHFSKVQSVSDCSSTKKIPNAANLLSAAMSQTPISTTFNPFSENLQNVDGNTITMLADFFGISNYAIPQRSNATLNNLRERRNAIAHGRESSSAAGERFTILDLRNTYTVADDEISRFIRTLQSYVDQKQYVIH